MNRTFQAILCIALALTGGSSTVFSQNTFQRFYITHGWDVVNPAIVVQSTTAGVDHYLQVGESRNELNSFSHVVLNKVDENGELIWSREYADEQYNTGNKLMETNNGDYIITGHTFSSPGIYNSNDLMVTRVSPNGTLVWSNTYGNDGGGHFSFGLTEEASTGDLFIGGFSNGSVSLQTIDSEDFNITKLDASGNLIWSYEYGGLDHERGTNVCLDHAGGTVLISGNIGDYWAGVLDIALVAVNSSNGAVQWAITYGGAGMEEAYIKPINPNHFLLVGWTTSFGVGGEDMLVMKIDNTGNVIWAKTYGIGFNERAYDVVEVSDGYVLSGFTDQGPHGKLDAIGMKIGHNGNLMWAQAYGGPLDDLSFSVSGGLSDNGLLFGAETSSFHFDRASKYLIKTNDQGLTCNCNNLNYPITVNDVNLDRRVFNPTAEFHTLTTSANTLSPANTQERGLCAGDFDGQFARSSRPNNEQKANRGFYLPGPGPQVASTRTSTPEATADLPNEEQSALFQVEVRQGQLAAQYEVVLSNVTTTNPLRLTVTNDQGKMVHQELLSANSTTIDLSKHAPGLYIFSVSNQDEQVAHVKVMHVDQ